MEHKCCFWPALSRVAVLGALLISTRVGATLIEPANPITGFSQIADPTGLMPSEPTPSIVWGENHMGDYAMLAQGRTIEPGFRSDASLRHAMPRATPPQLHPAKACEAVPEAPSIFVTSMILAVPFGLQGIRALRRRMLKAQMTA